MAHQLKIQFLPRNKINDQAWDHTITNSLQSRIYASVAWLDKLSPKWGAIVNEDYSIVMPLPIKKKFGTRYLAQPFFTQQLGIFSFQSIENKVYEDYIKMAQQHFSFGEICINGALAAKQSNLRKNYVLPLEKSYQEIYKNYSKSLIKNSLRPTRQFDLIYSSSFNVDKSVDYYKKLYYSRLQIPSKAFQTIRDLAILLKKTNHAFIRSVYQHIAEPLAISLFFKDQKTIYNILSATTPQGRKLNANYFLYDQLIQEFANQPLILDFEGSNIESIALFYKKFGAIMEPYTFVSWNHLNWPYNLFKKDN